MISSTTGIIEQNSNPRYETLKNINFGIIYHFSISKFTFGSKIVLKILFIQRNPLTTKSNISKIGHNKLTKS